MGLVWFLIVFPLVAAGACLAVGNERVRAVVVCLAAGVIAVASLALAVPHLAAGPTYYAFSSEALTMVFFVVDLAVCAYVIWRALLARKYAVFALACVQALLACILDLGPAGSAHVSRAIAVDALSAIMVLVIGLVGCAIVVYALGYMSDFQREQDKLAQEGAPCAPNRVRLFFAVMFVFLSAMYLIVLSNDMAWMLCGWEVTTVCSFFLIGYTKTPEATRNAFRQIWMNLIGGISFQAALIFVGAAAGVMELDRFVALGQVAPTAAMLPLALLALAALTKAAQMPFHTWLLGAMVAPTPTSALLHSSTMVKAGVYLLIRLSPLMGTYVSGLPRMGINPVGLSVMLVGATTFLLASLIAVSQSNAKRVLAYSTIANLGLIVCCAGIGSAEAVWAAVFLLVFHACAKSLLFLCVGTAEHHIGSRDIERMDSLITRMPRLAALMALGMCSMFVAPFGMLVSKWAALTAFVGSGVLLIALMLVFGSAATFFFWAKWLAKVMAGRPDARNVEAGVHASEWAAMGFVAVLLVCLTVLVPVASSVVVAPLAGQIAGGAVSSPAPSDLVLMAVCALVTIVVPALVLASARVRAHGDGHQPNMGGVGLGPSSFSGAHGAPVAYEQRNWYLEDVFGEKTLGTIGTVACAAIAGMGVASALGLTVLFMGSVI